MRFTIVRRLWLGIGIIIVLFLAADLFSLRAARNVDAALDEVVDGGEERRGAAYDMRAALQALVTAVRLSISDPAATSATTSAARRSVLVVRFAGMKHPPQGQNRLRFCRLRA